MMDALLDQDFELAGYKFHALDARAVRDLYLEQIDKVRREHGLKALQSPRSAVLAHEAAHAVVGAHDGGPPNRVKIWRAKVSAHEEFADAVRGQWLGMNFGTAGGLLSVETPPEEGTKRITMIIAGLCGELAFDRGNFREGSSIDEIVVSQYTARIFTPDDDRAEYFWHGCFYRALTILKVNENPVRKLMEQLDRQHVVRGDKLERILADVEQIAPPLLALDDAIAFGRHHVAEARRCLASKGE